MLKTPSDISATLTLLAVLVLLPAPSALGQPQRNVAAGESYLFAPSDNVVNWPVIESDGRLFDDTVSILNGEYDDRERRPLLTYAGGMLRAWDAVTLKPLWREPFPCSFQPQLISTNRDRLLFATPFELFALAADDGRREWRSRVAGVDENVEDLVDSDRWRLFAANDEIVVAVDSRDVAHGFNSATGATRWRVEFGEMRPETIKVVGKYLVAIVNAEVGSAAVIRALSDGRLIGKVAIDDVATNGSIRNSRNGCVISSAHALVSVDLATATVRWRLPFEPSVSRRKFAANEDVAIWVDGSGIVTCVDLSSGRNLWATPVEQARDAGWVMLLGDERRVVFGGANAMVCLDIDTGRTTWRRTGRAMPFALWPMVLGRDILIVQKLDPVARAASATEASDRILVRRIDVRSGMAMNTTGRGDLIVGPLTQFAGIFAFRDALAVLDGPRIIGYVSTKAGMRRDSR